MGILISLAAIAVVIATAAVATSWLIARRAAAFGHHGRGRPPAGMGVVGGVHGPDRQPGVGAGVRDRTRPRRTGRGASARPYHDVVDRLDFLDRDLGMGDVDQFGHRTAGVADNTVTMVIAYLAGLVTPAALAGVQRFVRKPVGRPQHRWVIVAPDRAEVESNGESSPSAPPSSPRRHRCEPAGIPAGRRNRVNC